MKRIWAQVKVKEGKARHRLGGAGPILVEKCIIPTPVSVEIVNEEGAFFFLHLDEAGACIADTWHETLEAAKAQAEFEFGISDEDWKVR